jgi:endonuclease-3
MMESAENRITEILELFHRHYPRSRTALFYETPFQILVATILSAQCTDAKVNEITPGLFKKYPAAADFAGADPEVLEQEIRQTGFFRNKTKNIIGAAKKIVEDFDGKVPDNMGDLITLPGVARKTANIVLSSGYHKAEGIAVDTHVKRLSGRLGLSSHSDPDKIEQDLMALVPKEEWMDFNYMMVNHGRAVCQARKPGCPNCPLLHRCPFGEDRRSQGL